MMSSSFLAVDTFVDWASRMNKTKAAAEKEIKGKMYAQR